MGFCQLGGYSFRIEPSQVFFEYEIDSVMIPTIGGRVVQVYGATLGDMTVQGLFGEDRVAGKESWQLAEEFQQNIASMVEAQSAMPSTAQLGGLDNTPMHPPIRFLYNDDTADRRAAGLPIHNWDFMVYIKDLKDVQDSDYTIGHRTGKYSYGYTLTLFITNDNTGKLKTTAMDEYISRLAEGVGWKKTIYNGMMSKSDLQAYLAANSPDSTIHGLVLQEYQQAATGSVLQPGAGTTPTTGGTGTTPAPPATPGTP